MLRRKGKGPDHHADDGGEAPVGSAGERDLLEANREGGQKQDDKRLKAVRLERRLVHNRALRRQGVRHRGPPPSVVRAEIWRLRHDRLANGIPEAEVAAMFDPVGDGAGWSAQERGEALQVVLEERLRLRLHSMMPIDRTPAQMKAISDDNKLWQDLVRKKKRRVAERERKAALSSGDLDERPEDLYFAADEKSRTISSLMAAIGHGKAWRAPDGSKLSVGGLRQAAHRAADVLVSKDMIEEKFDAGARGLQMRLICRVFLTLQPSITTTSNGEQR